jgi:hypothetical protein
MLEFAVAGVPVAIVLVAVVELVKRLFHVEGDRAIVVAILVGVALALFNEFQTVWPAFGQWYEVVAGGALLGFAACGLFDAAQAVGLVAK